MYYSTLFTHTYCPFPLLWEQGFIFTYTHPHLLWFIGILKFLEATMPSGIRVGPVHWQQKEDRLRKVRDKAWKRWWQSRISTPATTWYAEKVVKRSAFLFLLYVFKRWGTSQPPHLARVMSCSLCGWLASTSLPSDVFTWGPSWMVQTCWLHWVFKWAPHLTGVSSTSPRHLDGAWQQNQRPGTAPSAIQDFTTQLWPPPPLPAWFSHRSLLFNHSHLDAVSACFDILFTRSMRFAPLTPSIPNALQSDCPGNPLQPTSTGRFQALQPLCWLSEMRDWYFPNLRSCASSILSSQGTVSSIRATCLVAWDQSTISGRRLVTAISSGNLSCLLRSTLISQSSAVPRIPEHLSSLPAFSPGLRKPMKRGPLSWTLVLFRFLSFSSPSASCASTWSWRHLNLPSVRPARQDDRMCSRFAGLLHCAQEGSSVSLHLWRFVGVGSTSYTELRRNFIRCPSMFQMSFQLRDLPRTLSHRVQLPCCFMATALACLLSSSTARISFCTIPFRSFALASFQLDRVMTPRPSLPWVTVPMISACCKRSSASFRAPLAFHFRPVFTTMFACRTAWSSLSRNIMANRTLAVSNSSTTDVIGNFNLLPELYSPIEQKLLGTDSFDSLVSWNS